MPTLEEAIQSQLRNIEKTSGWSLDELVTIVVESGLVKHTDVVAMLKQRYGTAHGAAHRVSLVARSRAAQASPAPADDLAPKKGYVSLRRRKQFAMLQPGAGWIDLGLILPRHPAAGRLEPAGQWNALFTHRVRAATAAEVDGELGSWLRAAYAAAA